MDEVAQIERITITDDNDELTEFNMEKGSDVDVVKNNDTSEKSKNTEYSNNGHVIEQRLDI